MASRLSRALRRMTAPYGFDAMAELHAPDTSGGDDAAVRRDGSSADLRDRQRELAFDMYAEALVRIADADNAACRRERRETA